jgi:hypothetical protein
MGSIWQAPYSGVMKAATILAALDWRGDTATHHRDIAL